MRKSCWAMGAMLSGMLFWGQAMGAGAWPDVESAVATGQKAPNDAAVVISIENYALLGSAHKVKYAENDGDGFENFLLKTRGVPKSKLHRLSGGATKEQMMGELEDAAKEARGGTLWFYFAGHGAVDPSDKSELLLGSDVPLDSRYQAARAVKLKDLQKIAEASGANRAIFVIDACAVELGERFAAPVSLSIGANSKSVIWQAAEMGQKSHALEAAGHGAFTYALLGALRGWADGETGNPGDHKVDLDEADLFVSRFLKEAGVRDQTPKMLKSSGMILSDGVQESAPSRDQFKQAQQSSVQLQVSEPVTKTVHSRGDTIIAAGLGAGGLAFLGLGAYLYTSHMDEKVDVFGDDENELDRQSGAVLMALGAGMSIYGLIHWFLTGKEVTQKAYFYASPLGVAGGFTW